MSLRDRIRATLLRAADAVGGSSISLPSPTDPHSLGEDLEGPGTETDSLGFGGGRAAATYGNLATGAGIPGKDPYYSSFWSSGNLTSESEVEIDSLTREGIASVIVGAPWADAIRPGFDLRGLPNEQQELVRRHWDRLRANAHLWKLNYLGDFWGDAVCVIGANDLPPALARLSASDRARLERDAFASPLDPTRLAQNGEVIWLRPFGRRSPWGYSSGYTRLEQGPIMSPRFGEPEKYLIYDFWAPARAGYRDMTRRNSGPLTVHHTRVLQSTTWNAESILVGLDPYLKAYQNALGSTGRAISTLSVMIMKIKDWYHQARHIREESRARLAVAALGMSLLNALIADKDREDVAFQSRNISGLDNAVIRIMEALCAAAKMPMFVLFGIDPKGFSTGSEITDRYLARVSDLQEARLTPQVRRLVQIILWAYIPAHELPDPDSWNVEWRPPRLPTEKEKAEAREAAFAALKTANEAIAAGSTGSGSLSSEEILSLYQGDRFTVDPTLSDQRKDPNDPTAAASSEQGDPPGTGDLDPAPAGADPGDLPDDEQDPEGETDEPPLRMPGQGHTLRTAKELAEEFGVRPSFVTALGKRRRIGMLPEAGKRRAAAFSREDFMRVVLESFRPVAATDEFEAQFDLSPNLFLDPNPNYHAARQRNPSDFVQVRVLRTLPNGVQIRGGRLKDGGSATQSVWLPTSEFSAAEARKWLREHDFSTGRFEAAASTSDRFSDVDLPACRQLSLADVQRWLACDQPDEERIAEAFKRYHETVNMSASELERWAESECSGVASLSRDPIERNLRILRTKREDWTLATARSAMRTVSFVSRMRGAERGEPAKEGCPSKRDISLKNWAYDPSK